MRLFSYSLLFLVFVLNADILYSSSRSCRNPIRIKVILLGNVAVGKTSILNKFINNDFSFDTKPTIGIDFFSRFMKTKKQIYNVHLWDTGGLERFDSITASYINGSAGVVLVFSLIDRESFTSIKTRWIPMLKSLGVFEKKTFFLLLGNKKDLVGEREVSKLEALKVAKELGANYYEISALKGRELVLSLDKFIAHIINKLQENLIKRGVKLQKDLSICDFDDSLCCF